VTTFRQSSSLRARPLDETLRLAETLAREVGVVRVTDTTRLDRIGVPVFASIRPGAAPLSLCVSAGKGMSPAEAKIGATMEAIELAFAEPGRARLGIVAATGRELASSGVRLDDLCPRADVVLDEDAPLDCVAAEEVDTGRTVLVPAECVFFPYAARFFSSDTNGLASGNSVLEATVHALAELFERDIATLQGADDRTRRVRNETLPAHLRELVERTERAGFAITVRAAPNEFGLPFFTATVREPGVRDGVHGGIGCHPWASIAATRALCEAFQARLTIIHGGRDDLQGHNRRFSSLSEAMRMEAVHARAERREAEADSVSYDEVGDHAARTPTIEAVYELFRDIAGAARLGAPLRVRLTPPELPLQVVKCLVPGLEFHASQAGPRVGPRLRAALAGRKPLAAM